ncbi:hypothetical protein EON82_22155 [bacterium]|nr:MAG: hypothetical protein EON82_22155 [bacterium]
MFRRSTAGLLLLAAIGCGGTQQQQTSVMAPSDPTSRNGLGVSSKPDSVFKPLVGTNSPLGSLKAISEKSALAAPYDGKVDAEATAKLTKLAKDGLKLDDAYLYVVADAQSPRVSVGEKGASVPLPVEAKANPDGTVWVVDAETRRVFTLSGVKREADKPAVVAESSNADLVRPGAADTVPPLGLVARAEEATGDIKHALRILVKGVGAEGAPEAGTRIRLKKSASEKGLPPLSKSVVRALKKYGAVLAVGEGAPSISALADPRWTKADAESLASLHMTDFEVIAKSTKSGIEGVKKAK